MFKINGRSFTPVSRRKPAMPCLGPQKARNAPPTNSKSISLILMAVETSLPTSPTSSIAKLPPKFSQGKGDAQQAALRLGRRSGNVSCVLRDRVASDYPCLMVFDHRARNARQWQPRAYGLAGGETASAFQNIFFRQTESNVGGKHVALVHPTIPAGRRAVKIG